MEMEMETETEIGEETELKEADTEAARAAWRRMPSSVECSDRGDGYDLL